MKEKIDFIIACGRNSEDYVTFLISTIENTTEDTKFRFLLGINDDSVEEIKLRNINSRFEIEIFDCRSSGHFSHGHGHALDELLKQVKTKYFIVCDCDVAFLTKGWDRIFLEEFSKESNLAAIGTEYDGNKYMNFPNVVMCMLKTELIKLYNISFKPAQQQNRKIKLTKKDAELFGRIENDIIDLDTGWEMCFKLRSNNHNSITLPLRRTSTSDDCIFLQEGVRGEEHSFKGTPICSHVGRSFTRRFTNPITQAWKSLVEEWLSEEST